jgi:DNA modification methylase
MMPEITILEGDWIERLRELPDCSVHCCVTSPPYWGLRDYGVAGQLGLEKTPEEYVAKLVEGFREVRRVLQDDGTLWVNLGDTYASTGRHTDTACNDRRGEYNLGNRPEHNKREFRVRGAGAVKPKDLVGIPWMVAFALRADGWYLRMDIIWHKTNPMPESVTDRPTKSHEYIFLLSRAPNYFYDAEAIKEPVSGNAHARVPGNLNAAKGQAAYEAGDHRQRTKAGLLAYSRRKAAEVGSGIKYNKGFEEACSQLVSVRNKRSVWSLPSAPYKEAHFATFPPNLIKSCILAGCPASGIVLDPFGGSGTTGQVALELGRSAILIELNPAYVRLGHARVTTTPGFGL